MANRDGSRADKKFCKVRLFITGEATNSRIAKENLERLREKLTDCDLEAEIVDVLERPEAALEHGVYVTPALQKLEPGPQTMIFGNLSDIDSLKKVFPEEIK